MVRPLAAIATDSSAQNSRTSEPSGSAAPAFSLTLALFVPYRLGIGTRAWLAPVMLVLGWVAGMCNEHTGPAAMVAMAAFLYTARRRLHAWMLAGMVGLWSYNGPAIMSAVKDANKVGQIKIVCFDEDLETLGGIKDGSIEANGERLNPGDAVRLFDVERLSLKGSGELVLWDLPDA